jgi:hypothetical protein
MWEMITTTMYFSKIKDNNIIKLDAISQARQFKSWWFYI